MQAIVQRMVLQHIPAGERVYTMGEAGDALYLIEQGEVGLTGENAGGVVEELGRVQQGGFFGEMSLLTGQARTEDAMAVRNTNLWILHKSDLDELADQYPAIGKALSQGLATRLSTDDQSYSEERFRSFELLEGLGETELKQVVANLRPMRYRAGEQIYRAATAADTLFLLEKGTVRIQPLSGGTMLLGPGEAFGERALLTNQPHNATSIAETDVDVWTLSKQDFDVLMNRYPSLAISMSRILSQRLAQVASGAPAEPAGVRPPYPTEPVAAPATNMPSRRRRAAQLEEEMPMRPAQERMTFAQWFANLTPFGKIRLALFILLLIWLLGIAAPAALLSLIQGTSVASGADLTSAQPNLLRAISAVHAVGSFELASSDRSLAQALAMADRMVPPTPVFTPMPTHTPVPSPTPLPTHTPLPTPTFTATPPPVVQQFVAAAPVLPTPEPVAQAAALPRAWDPRLDRLGVRVEDAAVASGQQYWRLIEARWWDEQEAGGKHHIYVEVLDENGSRIVGQPVTVYWGDGSNTGNTEDKAPPDYGYNYQMYAAGNAYSVKVEGLPSDVLAGAGMGDIERPRYGIHTAFLLTFQKTTKP
jgi:CRP-like cAMP-binding protein